MLFSSNYGVVNIKISVSQIHHILFLFDILTFLWTMRTRTTCVYWGEAAEGVKHCLQGIVHVWVCVHVCMWETDEVSCRPAVSLFSKSRSIWNQCLHLSPSYTGYVWNVTWLAEEEKKLLTWFQSQNNTKKKKREDPVTADCKRPHNWYAGPQRARLLSDQPRRRTARATHCRE